MKEGYQIRDQKKLHFMTFTIVDWVDVFTRKSYKDVIIESFNYCQKEKGMILTAYVIMSNHIHVIMGSKEGKLSDLVRDFKKFTAKTLLKMIETEPESRRDWILKRFEFAIKSHTRNEKYQFWIHDNHPEEIFTEKFLWTKIEYIHNNPVRVGIVSKSWEYLYSSASNYFNNRGLIEIDLAEVRIFDGVREYNYGL